MSKWTKYQQTTGLICVATTPVFGYASIVLGLMIWVDAWLTAFFERNRG